MRIKRVALLIALCSMLSACSMLNLIKKSSSPDVAVTPTPRAGSTAQANRPDASPSPYAGTPGAAATTAGTAPATPAPTAPGIGSGDFYVVQGNQRMGVVDGKGNVVLPMLYSQIDILFHSGSDAAFFAVPAHVNAAGGHSNEYGQIYGTDGKKLVNGTFRYAYAVDQDYIQVSGPDGKGRMRIGFIDHTGKFIVPCIYDDAYEYGNGFIGVKGESEKISKGIDIYDKQGKLLRSGTVNFRYADGQYLNVSDSTGNKYGLMDDRFQTVVPAVWDDVRNTLDGRFIVRKGSLQGLIDKSGAEIIPIKYYDFYDLADDSGSQALFVATDKNGSYLLDSKGKTLFHDGRYNNLQYADGIVLAYDAKNIMHAIDRSGKELIPPASYISWLEEQKLFECNLGDNKGDVFYTREGVKLPLPHEAFAQCIAADRFIIGVSKGDGMLYGLCDGQGNYIVKPIYGQLFLMNGDGRLVFAQLDSKGWSLFGIMDADGNILLPAAYEDLYGDPEQSLLYAKLGSIHGLIDTQGNWVWYMSDYDGLMD